MSSRMQVFLFILGIVAAAAIIVLTIASIVLQTSISSGVEEGYLYKIQRTGDYAEIVILPGEHSSYRNSGCILLEDEPKFRELVGEKIRVEWNAGFSMHPFWMECANPVRLVGDNE